MKDLANRQQTRYLWLDWVKSWNLKWFNQWIGKKNIVHGKIEPFEEKPLIEIWVLSDNL